MFSRALLPFALAVAAGFTSLLAPAAAEAQPTAPAGATAAAAPARFAVLDTRHVILNSEEGLRIQANLRKLSESRQAEFARMDKELNDEQDKLRKEEKAKGSSDALDKRKAEFRQKVAQLQQAQLDFQRDMMSKENDLTKPMIQKIGNIVKNIAQQEAFDLVVDKNAVVFFKNELDITERVLGLYNQGDSGGGKGGATKKPAEKKPAEKKPAEKKAAPGGAKKPK
ncbi:MAG: OmpH family outer membrane protein [Polyangiaceae bacterium]|nr:OmpH family outer membrane protein [Polyangiaceae bacterium]